MMIYSLRHGKLCVTYNGRVQKRKQLHNLHANNNITDAMKNSVLSFHGLSLPRIRINDFTQSPRHPKTTTTTTATIRRQRN